MVTLDYSGSEALLVGCNDVHGFFDNAIYNLTWENWGHGDQFHWEIMPQKLEYARSQAVAMMIPRSMTDCSLGRTKYPTFFHGERSTILERSTSYQNVSLHLHENPHNKVFHYARAHPNLN